MKGYTENRDSTDEMRGAIKKGSWDKGAAILYVWGGQKDRQKVCFRYFVNMYVQYGIPCGYMAA